MQALENELEDATRIASVSGSPSPLACSLDAAES